MFLILDAVRLVRDIRSNGSAIRLWGDLLNLPQLIGGLVFMTTIEGQAVLVIEILTLVVAGQIHRRTPFSLLIGTCHAPWLLLLPWLLYRLQSFEHSIWLKAWGFYVAATISISLVFDIRDVYRYLRGEKNYSWAN